MKWKLVKPPTLASDVARQTIPRSCLGFLPKRKENGKFPACKVEAKPRAWTTVRAPDSREVVRRAATSRSFGDSGLLPPSLPVTCLTQFLWKRKKVVLPHPEQGQG